MNKKASKATAKSPNKPLNTPFKPKGHAPKNPLECPRFADITTFGRLPYTQNLKKVDVAIVGIPFDGGATYRTGARFGPRALRAASVLNRNVHSLSGIHVYEKISAIDYGDISCNPLNINKTFAEIEKVYIDLLKENVTPIALGGDHSVLYPILKSAKTKFQRFGLIQFDAHTDTADQAWGEKFHHGTPVRRLIEGGFLNGRDVYQIGIRGPLTSKSQLDWDLTNGINQLSIDDYRRGRFEQFIAKIDPKIPYYLSFDIDGVDPAYAPGTGTPVVGGLTSYEALDCIRKLAGHKFIGFDLMEVCPAYDHAEITSLLGSALVFEFMNLKAQLL